MQKIKVECDVPADMHERVAEALNTLSELNVTIQQGNSTASFRPIDSFNLAQDGKLSLVIQGLAV